MPEPVKSHRRYHSPARAERLDATRRAILDSARRMFGRHGYAGTKMDQIAEDSGLAVQTVYKLFRSKSGVLAALALNQPLDELADLERKALENPDPRRQLATVARRSRLFAERSADLIEMVREGRRTDADLAAFNDRGEAGRRAGARQQIAALLRKTRLRRGLGRDQATDILWLLAGPDTYIPLVGTAGWSGARYERWLRETLVRELLG
ncbi:MAG TPA: helix-turn-helix domain-containing protein [Stellaceae bacterium]|nr:helix-turn-helix domain-containing protein [Stellaceae bacterium]